MNIKEIQRSIQAQCLDGWLFCDFRNREPFAYQVLGISPQPLASRRWYYFIPARGTPKKLMSRVEPHRIDELPGSTLHYTTWQELTQSLTKMLGRAGRKIAMQYSPQNALPYVSTVDAGTVELIRSLGHKVVSSQNLLTAAIGRMTPRGYQLLSRAAREVDKIRAGAFAKIQRGILNKDPCGEFEVQQWIMKKFGRAGLTTYSPPMVGIGAHPADPHFETDAAKSSKITHNQPLLIDLWAKVDDPKGIYFDSTWVAYTGKNPPSLYQRAFNAARDARDAAFEFIASQLQQGRPCRGCEIDVICRKKIERAGFGKYFIHRTGHSITTSTHGEGVNIDDFETHDDRELLPLSCFSIEPGIYLPGKCGVRTEITVAINASGNPEILGELQREIVIL